MNRRELIPQYYQHRRAAGVLLVLAWVFWLRRGTPAMLVVTFVVWVILHHVAG